MGVRGHECEHHPGPGADFKDDRWGDDFRVGFGSVAGAEAAGEVAGFGGGGERVEEEVGVFGGFVDAGEGDVGG